jgi:polyphosphate kinase 2 (PPK2 family)
METLYNKKGKLKKKVYEKELARLQEELVKLQYWIRDQGLKVVVLFEGRNAAGKGGPPSSIRSGCQWCGVRIPWTTREFEREARYAAEYERVARVCDPRV